MGAPVVRRFPARAGGLAPQAFRVGAPTWLDQASWSTDARENPYWVEGLR